MGVVEYKKHTKILVTNFNLEDDTLSFFGEIQATGNDAYLEAFNHLLDTLKSSLRKKMTVTFRNTCLKDDVFSTLIFHLLGEITDQDIELEVYWYYDSEESLEVGKELNEVFECKFTLIESIRC